MKNAYFGMIAFVMLLVGGSLRAQNPGDAKPVWLDLGHGRGYYDWIYVLPGVGARTDTQLYLKTYDKIADQGSSHKIAAAQAAAVEVRSNAEQRVRTALEQFSQHDPEFFQQVMEEQKLMLVK